MPQFRSMQSSGNNAEGLSKKQHSSGGLLSKYNSGGLPQKHSSGGLLSKYSSGGSPAKVSKVEVEWDQEYRNTGELSEKETELRPIVSAMNSNRSLQVQPNAQYMATVTPLQHALARSIPLRLIVSSSAMERMPVVIPGRSMRLRQTDKLPQQKRLHPIVRQGILTISMLCIFFFCMTTLTPLGGTHSNILLQWVKVSSNSLNIMGNGGMSGGSNGSAEGTWTDLPAGTTAYYIALARADAVKWGISPDYYQRQIQQESHFDPYAQSGVGAIGIAQFMPSTAALYNINPYDPVQALDGGAHMMSDLNNEFNGDYAKALAAYNAGPGAVDDAVAACGSAWLSCMDGQPQAYVEIIMYGASY